MYTYQDILDYMNSGRVFSLKVAAFDKKRKKGRNILEYQEAVLLRPEVEVAKAHEATQRQLTAKEVARFYAQSEPKDPKSPRSVLYARYPDWFGNRQCTIDGL